MKLYHQINVFFHGYNNESHIIIFFFFFVVVIATTASGAFVMKLEFSILSHKTQHEWAGLDFIFASKRPCLIS